MGTRGEVSTILILWIASLHSSMAGVPSVPLQLRPEIGKKQTMRLTTLVTSTPVPPRTYDVAMKSTNTVEIMP